MSWTTKPPSPIPPPRKPCSSPNSKPSPNSSTPRPTPPRTRCTARSRFKNKFRVPRYADLPRDQLTDAILYVNALELHCTKRLEADRHPPLPPFLQGEFGSRLLIHLEGGDRYSVTHLGITEIVADLADLIAIDQAMDVWRDFAKRKELNYYRAGAANVASTRP